MDTRQKKSTVRDFMWDPDGMVMPIDTWRICNNKDCDKRVIDSVIDSKTSMGCACQTVTYCSSFCRRGDCEEHVCPLNDAKAEVTNNSCDMIFSIRGEDPTVVRVTGDFVGVKRGEKYVRGSFQWETRIVVGDNRKLVSSYNGEMTTIKYNGRVVMAPHGKGTLVSASHTFVGNFDRGVMQGTFDLFHASGMTYRGTLNAKSMTGIFEALHGNSIVYADNSVWKFRCEFNTRLVVSEWEKTASAIVLDMGRGMEPRVVAKSDLDAMIVERVIYQEKVRSVGFRCCVVKGERETFVAMCATTGCFVHGKYTYAPVCMKVDKLVDRDLSEKARCTCRDMFEEDTAYTHATRGRSRRDLDGCIQKTSSQRQEILRSIRGEREKGRVNTWAFKRVGVKKQAKVVPACIVK